MTTAPSASPSSSTTHATLGAIVGRIAGAIERGELSPGDVASLRRLEPHDPSASAFWRVCALFLEPAAALPANDPLRADAEKRWAGILNALAILQGCHRPGTPLGSALAEAGYSELRFSRLLRARDDVLLDEIRSGARFLASKAQPADLTDLARLVLSDGRADEETVRRRIARSYYSIAND